MSLDDKVKPAFICTPSLRPYNEKCHQTVLGVSASYRQRLALDHTVAYAVLFHALSYAAKGNITKHLSNKGGDQTVMGSPHPNGTPGMCVRSKGCIRLRGSGLPFISCQFCHPHIPPPTPMPSVDLSDAEP